MGTSLTRVLLVDDYKPWHGFVSTLLAAESQFQIAGQAWDGLEAVQRAQDLRPDLVLLDIGLPSLNGIQAALRIRKVSPASRIVFVSQTRSPEIAEAALEAGGQAYVVKSDAGRDLLRAIHAVLNGKQFLSTGLGSVHGLVAEAINPKNTPAPICHDVEFYQDNMALVEGFAAKIKTGLQAGRAVVLIASDRHRSAIFEKLETDLANFAAVLQQGRYIQVDNRETLAACMVNGLPDPALCSRAIGEMIRTATQAAPHHRVLICGECAPELLADGNFDGAIRLEHLWDELTRKYEADTFCAYLWSQFPEGQNDSVFQQICGAHNVVHGRPSGC